MLQGLFTFVQLYGIYLTASVAFFHHAQHQRPCSSAPVGCLKPVSAYRFREANSHLLTSMLSVVTSSTFCCLISSGHTWEFRLYADADFPARYPLDHANCRLNPPQSPVTSRISPARNNPLFNADSIEGTLISDNGIPPAVT